MKRTSSQSYERQSSEKSTRSKGKKSNNYFLSQNLDCFMLYIAISELHIFTLKNPISLFT